MAEIQTGKQVTQLGREVTPGSAVAALIRLLSMGFDINPTGNMQTYKPQGSKYLTQAVPGQEWSAGSLTGRPVFDEIPYLFDMTTGNRSSSVTGTTGQQHVFTADPNDPDATGSYTIEKGDSNIAGRVTHAKATDASVTINRNEVTIDGSIMGQLYEDAVQMSTNEQQTVTITGSPTGGDFTLTYAGQTTAGIAYNANAAAVASALEALSNIDDVDVTGGPGPDTPWVVEFRGTLRQTDVAAMTASAAGLTGGTTPAVAVTETTPGVAPSTLPQIPIQPKHFNVYLDDTAGAIGTTQLLRAFQAQWSLGNLISAIWPLNRNLASFATTVENVDPTATCMVQMAADATGRALLTDTLRAGTTKYLQVDAIGPAIAGGSAFNTLRLQAAVKIANWVPFGDLNGLVVLPWPFVIVEDGDLGWPYRWTVINSTASY